MASIEKRTTNGKSVWRAHYRTPAGKQRNKTFHRKVDAERFLTSVESSKNAGSYVDPALSRVTVGEWASCGWQARPSSNPRPRNGTKVSCVSTSIPRGATSSFPPCRIPRSRCGSQTDEDTGPSVGSQDPPRALTHARYGCQGRTAGAKRRHSGQPPRPVKHERRYLTHAQVDAWPKHVVTRSR